MHVQVAVMKIISNVSIRDASNFAIIIPFVLSSIFVYLVARHLFGEQIGLFAMLLVNVSNFHIYWGSAPQTTSYGIILCYILLYILFNIYYLRPDTRWYSISVFLIITLIITHAVSSFIFVVIIFALFFGSRVYNQVYKDEIKLLYGEVLLISAVALLQRCFTAINSKNSGKSFFDQIVSSLYFYITGEAGFLDRPEATIIEVATTLPPFIERFADTLGISLYIFFAIIRSLMTLSFRYRNQIKFSYILVLIILFGITFAFPVFGIMNLIPDRWFVFEYFFVSMFAALSIFKITNQFDRNILKISFLVSVFCILTFFMSTCTISNLDSPIWLKDSTVSTTYTVAEIQGAETMSHYSDNLFSDSRYGNSVLGIYLDIETTSLQSTSQIIDRKNEIFLWRNYILESPI